MPNFLKKIEQHFCKDQKIRKSETCCIAKFKKIEFIEQWLKILEKISKCQKKTHRIQKSLNFGEILSTKFFFGTQKTL
jgi:hypothetical protein